MSKRHNQALALVASLGTAALVLSLHMMEDWPVPALWIAVAGILCWLIGKGGAFLVDAMEAP